METKRKDVSTHTPKFFNEATTEVVFREGNLDRQHPKHQYHNWAYESQSIHWPGFRLRFHESEKKSTWLKAYN